MAAFGYLVYLLRANQPHRARELQRLNAAGTEWDTDLLESIESNLKALGSKFIREPKIAEGFRIKQLQRKNRTLWVRINKGPAGTGGEAYDIETEASVETTVNQALLSGLRAMFVMPEDSFYGLLFVERIGIRQLKEPLLWTAIRPAGHGCGAIVHVEAFAEAKDWKTVIEPLQTLRISEMLAVQSSAEDASTYEDTRVRIVTEGSLAHQVGERVKDILFERLDRREEAFDTAADVASRLERRRTAEKNAFTVQDEEDLRVATAQLAELKKLPDADDELEEALSHAVPVEPGAHLQHRRYEVSLGQDKPERTFVVEGSTVPQFVYELGQHLPDSLLRRTWIQHADSILRNRGVRLTAKWDADLK